MWSKALAIGLSLLIGVSFLLGACTPAVPPPPEQLLTPEQPSEGVASISVDKMVKVEGGDTWEEEIEQCVCQNVEFQIIVSNDGEEPLINIGVSDLIPVGLEYVQGSATPPPTPDPPILSTNPVWNFPGPIAPNSSIQIIFSAHVASEGEHENCVKVQAETDDGEVVNDDDCAVVVGLTCELEHKMHYPQLPEGEDGFSVIATLNAAAPYYVADDWHCSQSGLVTDIHFWGHWDGFNAITEFKIVIAEKISACDVGEILWQQNFPISEVSVSDYIPATPSGWYNPPGDYNDNVGEGYWQYNIENIDAPFCQQEGEEYWLIVGAYVEDPFEGVWGWRNTTDHFGCNAMYSHFLDQGWQPLDSPPDYDQPLDMAFIITGGEPCEPCQCEEWNDVEVSWTDESGTSQSWTGSCGDTVEPISNPSGLITVTSSMGCIPDDCGPDYTWQVTTYPGMSLPAPPSGSGLPAFTPQGSGWNSYVVTLNASCDGVECPLCTLYMRVHVPEVTPSINVDKLVSADGGDTWEEDIEQCVCQNVQFQITVTNDGDVPLSNIVISDYLPDCLEYVDGPAVEGICKTQLPYIPYYNLPGTNTPTWKCSELAPGNSVQVIYTAHVVESGGCKNQVSVEGEYNGQIVTDVDGASVTGITGTCEEVSLPVCRCNLDDFSSPDPSDALLGWIDSNYPGQGGTRACDEVRNDRYWAHTFTGLEPPTCCHIVSAILEITVRNNHYNDSLLVGFIDSDTDTWDYSRGLDLLGVPVGVTSTITLDLSSLPTSSGPPVNLLSSIGDSLDVVVQDDSTVDCAVLDVTYGP